MKYSKTKNMIMNALLELNDSKGSTVPAIKKYLTDRYDVSKVRLTQTTILLRTAGEEKWLLQVAGSGASSGSRFKLPPETKKAMQKEKKKEAAMNSEEEKAPPKAIKTKTATKRKMEKPTGEKESPAKKKKASVDVPKKKTAASKAPKKAASEATKKKAAKEAPKKAAPKKRAAKA